MGKGMKPGDWWTLLLTSIGLITAFGLAIAKANTGPLNIPDYEITLLLGLASIILGYTIRCWTRSLDNEKNIQRLQASIEQETMLSSLMSRLIRSAPIVQKVGVNTLLSQTSSIKPVGRGFSITGTNWAMRSNTNFWKALYKSIHEPEVGEKKPNLKCYVVHSGDPHIWKTRDALASLEQQKLFVEAGGEINRIIVGDWRIDEIKAGIMKSKQLRSQIADVISVGPDSNGDAVKQENGIQNRGSSQIYYGDLIRLMAMYKVRVFYAKGFDDDYASDFALVKHQDRSVVMEWVNTHRFGPVKECIFHDLEDDNEEFENRWKSLRSRAVELTELARRGTLSTDVRNWTLRRMLPGVATSDGAGDREWQVEHTASVL